MLVTSNARPLRWSPPRFWFPRHPGYNKSLAQTALLLSGYEERMPDAPPDRLQAEPEDQKPAPKALKSTLTLPIGGKENPSDAAPKLLKSTLNLPQTPFPMKANLPQNEPARLAGWQQQHLYAQIRAARA